MANGDDLGQAFKNGSISLNVARKYGYNPDIPPADEAADAGLYMPDTSLGQGPIQRAIGDRFVNAMRGTLAGAQQAGAPLQALARYPGDVLAAGTVGMAPSPAQMVPWAANTAMMAAGAGSPFSVLGAVGSAGGRLGGIRAYHGSPYDFERFDLSKIGTGEGAQAYGHGLYFAEKEKVAQDYRDALSNATVNGQPFNANNPEHAAISAIQTQGGSKPAAIAQLREELANDPRDPWLKDVLYHLQRNDLPQLEKGGKMYEVNINAHPEEFLDWDKKIRDMPDEVQKKLLALPGTHEGDIGSQIYHRRVDEFGQEGATQQLRDAGIKGVRYLDQGSRGAGGPGTHNYVVFDDKLIDIVKKYGLAGLIAGGAYHAQLPAGGPRTNGGT